MITRLILISVLCLSAVTVSADDPAQANRLLVEAMKSLQAAEKEQEAAQKLALQKSALAKLNEIVDNHPSSDLAVKLITNQEIGSLSLPKLLETIDATEQQTARELSFEYLDANNLEEVAARLNRIADPAFRQKVLDWILLRLSAADAKPEDRMFFARLVEDTHARDDHFQTIATDQAIGKNHQAALSIAESIQSEFKREVVRKEVAVSHARAGDVENALTLAQQVQNMDIRNEILEAVVTAQLDSDDIQGAWATANMMAETGRKTATIRLVKEQAWRHEGLILEEK